MSDHPSGIVGSGYVPFEMERDLQPAVEAFSDRDDAARLFDEPQDDRHVLETALAGRADILTTADLPDFARGPAIPLGRDDVVLFAFAGRMVVIATPAFTAHWLRQGIVLDAAFVAAHSANFVPTQAEPRTR